LKLLWKQWPKWPLHHHGWSESFCGHLQPPPVSIPQLKQQVRCWITSLTNICHAADYGPSHFNRNRNSRRLCVPKSQVPLIALGRSDFGVPFETSNCNWLEQVAWLQKQYLLPALGQGWTATHSLLELSKVTLQNPLQAISTTACLYYRTLQYKITWLSLNYCRNMSGSYV
jgi:hypothetical protein